MKNFRMIPSIVFLFLSLFLLAGGVTADVTLSALFSDHCVLQQDRLIPVWGRAAPRERVTVQFERPPGTVCQAVATVADARGQWRVTLPRLKAGGPGRLIVEGTNRVVRDDVQVGEVWICSGQSNMEWPVRSVRDAPKEIAAARQEQVRLFTVPHRVSEDEQLELAGSWRVCSPDSVPGFSAVGYFFGRELHGHLRVPVGLIQASWGGTPAEAWTRGTALARKPALKPILERYAKARADFDNAKQEHQKKLEAWKTRSAKARAQGKRAPRRPRAPFGPGHPHAPAGLWNGMVAPLVPFAFRGVIWYQGESNASRAWQYRTLFPSMIQDWRQAWSQGDFPFLFVQLANFRARKEEPAESDWAELREAQAADVEAAVHGHGRGDRHRRSAGYPPTKQTGRGEAVGAAGAGRGLW